MEAPKIQLEFSLDEMIVLSGLLVGHRLRVAHSVDENHWKVLEGLHVKFVNSLVVLLDEKEKLKEEVKHE